MESLRVCHKSSDSHTGVLLSLVEIQKPVVLPKGWKHLRRRPPAPQLRKQFLEKEESSCGEAFPSSYSSSTQWDMLYDTGLAPEAAQSRRKRGGSCGDIDYCRNCNLVDSDFDTKSSGKKECNKPSYHYLTRSRSRSELTESSPSSECSASPSPARTDKKRAMHRSLQGEGKKPRRKAGKKINQEEKNNSDQLDDKNQVSTFDFSRLRTCVNGRRGVKRGRSPGIADYGKLNPMQTKTTVNVLVPSHSSATFHSPKGSPFGISSPKASSISASLSCLVKPSPPFHKLPPMTLSSKNITPPPRPCLSPVSFSLHNIPPLTLSPEPRCPPTPLLSPRTLLTPESLFTPEQHTPPTDPSDRTFPSLERSNSLADALQKMSVADDHEAQQQKSDISKLAFSGEPPNFNMDDGGVCPAQTPIYKEELAVAHFDSRFPQALNYFFSLFRLQYLETSDFGEGLVSADQAKRILADWDDESQGWKDLKGSRKLSMFVENIRGHLPKILDHNSASSYEALMLRFRRDNISLSRDLLGLIAEYAGCDTKLAFVVNVRP